MESRLLSHDQIIASKCFPAEKQHVTTIPCAHSTGRDKDQDNNLHNHTMILRKAMDDFDDRAAERCLSRIVKKFALKQIHSM